MLQLKVGHNPSFGSRCMLSIWWFTNFIGIKRNCNLHLLDLLLVTFQWRLHSSPRNLFKLKSTPADWDLVKTIKHTILSVLSKNVWIFPQVFIYLIIVSLNIPAYVLLGTMVSVLTYRWKKRIRLTETIKNASFSTRNYRGM